MLKELFVQPEDSGNGQDRLKQAMREINELKVTKTRLAMEKYNLELKLGQSEKKISTERSKNKQFAKELRMMRSRVKKTKQPEVEEQTREDAIREKETFTAVKKQLFKQLVEEKERSKKLEIELNSLKNSVTNPLVNEIKDDVKVADSSQTSPGGQTSAVLGATSWSAIVPIDKTSQTQMIELRKKLNESEFAKQKTQKMLLSAQENIEALRNKLVLNREDMNTLKIQLSSTSLQVRETELECKRKLDQLEIIKNEEMKRMTQRIENVEERWKAEITNMKGDHIKSHENQLQIIERLSNSLDLQKSNFAKRGLEYEKISAEVAEYREKISTTSEKLSALEQRNKRLEREKRALIVEVKRLQGSDGKLISELSSERKAKEQWESKFLQLQKEYSQFVEKQKETEAERV